MSSQQAKQSDTKVQKKVEEMGIVFEKAGLTPMHGRVFAYLLLAEPPYKDFYEIQEFLKASKSAISNALKYLMDQGMIDYITFSGDRRRYFRVNHKTWLERYKDSIRSIATFRNLIEEVLQVRENSKHLDFNEQLQNMLDFQTHIANGLEELIRSWEDKQA